MIIPVILSGGSGTRLWPLSRKLYPKQLLPLTGEQTLLQQTATRLAGLEHTEPPIIICSEEHRFLVAEQLRKLAVEPGAIILEPVGRNTAPAVAVAALHALANGNDPLLLVLPADHLIAKPEIFRHAVTAGARFAEQGKLVTFGILPDKPETGYGYIKQGEKLSDQKQTEYTAFQVERFVEKPDIKKAQQYLDSGRYYWNSGMFLFQADRFLEELKQYDPEMLTCCEQAYSATTSDLDFQRLDKEAFAASPNSSIDYAVMEKTKHSVVIPVDPGWNDIGSWSALWEIGAKDLANNVTVGDTMTQDTHNSYLHATNRLVATVGVDDLVVIETADAVLVSTKNRVQEVKMIVKNLKDAGRYEAELHPRVYRPWGSYETLAAGDRYQVKRIIVNPKALLSLQKHHHRAEHWIVVKGTAIITRGEESITLTENESTYIPLGVTHRLENPGIIPLELIEVQSGSYLGEDDIIRFEDTYGRGKE